MKPAKVELLAKVLAWRVLSMTCGFFIAYAFTGEFRKSAGITIVIGPTLMLVQWGFELFWDKHIRERLRHALSREHSRIGWLVRKRRDSRNVGVDKHEERSRQGQEEQDSTATEDAGGERTPHTL